MTYLPGSSEPRREPLGQPAYTPPIASASQFVSFPAPHAAIPTDLPPYTQALPPPPSPKKSRTKLVLLVVAGLVALCGVGTIVAATTSNKPAAAPQQTFFPDCPFAAGGCPKSASPAPAAATGVPVKCADGVTSNTGLPNYCSDHGGVAPAVVVTTKAAPPAPPPVPSIEDGTWTVGVDVPPGAYRVTANVPADCYWAILKTGSNGQIIKNDIPGGGRPQVTLTAGQDFKTDGCGTWHKVG